MTMPPDRPDRPDRTDRTDRPDRPGRRAEWHVAADVLVAYVDQRLDPARTSSVDQHLLTCATCRAGVATQVSVSVTDQDALGAIWADVIDDVDRPRVGVVERAMRRIGIHDHVARLLAATPALRLSWLAGVAVTLLFAAANAGRDGGTDDALLLVAPLVPLLGIATAYGRPVDPLFELVKASPLPASKLFLLRALAVLATAIPLALVASLLLPVDGWRAVSWLAPALGLAGLALALSTWVRPLVATGVAGAAWLVGLAVLWRRGFTGGGGLALHALPAFAPSGQILFLVLAAAGAAVFAWRADRLDLPLPSPLAVPLPSALEPR